MAQVQLRRYEIASGKMEIFLEHWREVVPVREKFGFTVLFGFANRSTNEFVWAVRHDGDFEAAYEAYEASAEHHAIVERMRPHGLLKARHTGMMEDVLAPPDGAR